MESRWMRRKNENGEEEKFYPITHVDAIIGLGEIGGGENPSVEEAIAANSDITMTVLAGEVEGEEAELSPLVQNKIDEINEKIDVLENSNSINSENFLNHMEEFNSLEQDYSSRFGNCSMIGTGNIGNITSFTLTFDNNWNADKATLLIFGNGNGATLLSVILLASKNSTVENLTVLHLGTSSFNASQTNNVITISNIPRYGQYNIIAPMRIKYS